jgi:tetratricopeptide (TPR) repeat protein
MVTKTKALETSVSALDPSVEQAFSKGLAKLNAGDLPAAASAFESVQTRTVNQDNLGLSRTAQRYLTAIQDRLKDSIEPCHETLEMSAQLLLNRTASIAALQVIDKAIQELPQRAVLYYLKAIAYAQMEQGQESADALIKAVALDGDFVFRFRLEPDFDSVRNVDAFLALPLD